MRCLLLLVFVLLSTPAFADWRTDMGTFRVGIPVDRDALATVRAAQPFRRALADALDMPVEIVALPGQPALVSALAGGRLDYAVLSATAFASAWRVCKCVEPQVTSVAADGSWSFRSVLLSRSDGPSRLSDISGRTTVVPGKASFAGWLLPSRLLAKRGVTLGKPPYETMVERNADAALAAFIGGKGDILLGWVPEVATTRATRGTRALAEEQGVDLRIVWRSAPIPHGPHTVRRNLAPEAKAALAAMLPAMRQSDPAAYFGLPEAMDGGFRAVTLEDYRPLIDLLADER